jgi:hypothetical protein
VGVLGERRQQVADMATADRRPDLIRICRNHPPGVHLPRLLSEARHGLRLVVRDLVIRLDREVRPRRERRENVLRSIGGGVVSDDDVVCLPGEQRCGAVDEVALVLDAHDPDDHQGFPATSSPIASRSPAASTYRR